MDDNCSEMRKALVLARERIVETMGYYDEDADKEDYKTLLMTIDAALASQPLQQGNASAMLDALDKIHLIAMTNINECVGDKSDIHIVDLANSALSTPARNCDVGTPEEQYYRFEDYCAENSDVEGYDMCRGCPLEKSHDCRIAWMNLPYKKED